MYAKEHRGNMEFDVQDEATTCIPFTRHEHHENISAPKDQQHDELT
jgi:hypothetical protein